MLNRRVALRAPIGGLLFNKYIDGFPHVAELLDLSEGGMRIRRIHEPEGASQCFAIEFEVPGTRKRIWLWTRQVWANAEQQALRFVGITGEDRAALAAIVAG